MPDPQGYVLNVDWTAVKVMAGILAGWTGLFLAAIKWLSLREVHRVDEALRENSKDHAANEVAHANLERQILRLEGQLPNEYVRREDWIRFSASIDAKLDRLNEKFDAHLKRKE
ncbi:MAG: hypothetical protein ACOYXN_00475 [Acidobacteriota bacterium]